MKQWIGFLLIAALITACQKGDEDPVFSLVSRKGRITGDWTVTSFTGSEPQLVRNYNGSEITYTIGDTLELSRNLVWTMNFDGDGSYVITEVEEFPEDQTSGNQSYSETREEKGNWEFTGGNNTPSKSQLLLMMTEVKVTRSDQGSNINIVSIDRPSEGRVLDLVRLTNDELKMEVDESVAFAGGTDRVQLKYELKKN